MKNGRADALSQKTNYFKEKEPVKYLILKTNQDNILKYNHIVLAAIFRVKNDVFAKQLQKLIQEDETTQAILLKIS